MKLLAMRSAKNMQSLNKKSLGLLLFKILTNYGQILLYLTRQTVQNLAIK